MPRFFLQLLAALAVLLAPFSAMAMAPAIEPAAVAEAHCAQTVPSADADEPVGQDDAKHPCCKAGSAGCCVVGAPLRSLMAVGSPAFNQPAYASVFTGLAPAPSGPPLTEPPTLA